MKNFAKKLLGVILTVSLAAGYTGVTAHAKDMLITPCNDTPMLPLSGR